MGGFMGDVLKPVSHVLTPFSKNLLPRPKSSHERTLEKQTVMREEDLRKQQLLSEQQKVQESERQYWLPENIRRRAGVANQEAEAGKARQTASQYLGG